MTDQFYISVAVIRYTRTRFPLELNATTTTHLPWYLCRPYGSFRLANRKRNEFCRRIICGPPTKTTQPTKPTKLEIVWRLRAADRDRLLERRERREGRGRRCRCRRRQHVNHPLAAFTDRHFGPTKFMLNFVHCCI